MEPARPATVLALLALLVAGRVSAGVVSSAGIQRPCESDSECVVEHTTCTDQICKCAEDFVEFNDDRCLPVAKEYGDPCEDDRQCTPLTPGQNPTLIMCYPYTDTCSCPRTYHFADGVCWFSSNLSQSCGSNYNCIAEHSICETVNVGNSICVCMEGFIPKDNECYYEKCEAVPGSFYDDGDCQCEDPDYVVNSDYTECIPIAFGGHGAECHDSRQCLKRMGAGAVCEIPRADDNEVQAKDGEDEVSGTCACGDGYHYLHGHCWPEIAFGAECSSDEECQEFHNWSDYACVEGACACAADAVGRRPGDSPLCRRVARENEECDLPLDCNTGLTCDSSSYICQASTAIHAISNITHAKEKARNSAAPKISRIECGVNEEPTFSGKECVCKHGFFKISEEDDCVPELGMPCELDEDLEIPGLENSLCRRSAKLPYSSEEQNGVWGCSGGFSPAPSKRKCLKNQEHNSNCEHSTQCAYYGGICVEGGCQCDEEYRYERQLCWPNKVTLDDPCKTDEDCVVANAGSVECVVDDEINDGVCQCKEGYYPSDGDCKAVALGGACNDDDDCLFADGHPSVTCKNGECACSNGYYEISATKCEFDLRVNCDFIEGAEENDDGECVCIDPDTVIDGSNTECIEVAWGGVLDLCNDSVQCVHRMGQGAVCAGNACNCQAGFHYLRGRCWRTRGFGESCTADEECHQYSEGDAYVCTDEGRCACAPYALPKGHPDNVLCRRVAEEGEDCESDLDCKEGEDLVCVPTDTSVTSSPTICKVSSRIERSGAPSTSKNYNDSRAEWLSHRQQILAALAGEEGSGDDSDEGCGLNEERTPSGNECVCQRGYYSHPSASMCIPELGEPCYVGEEHTYIEYATCRRSAKFPYTPTVEGIFGGIDRTNGQKDGIWTCHGGFLAGETNRVCEVARPHNYNCMLDLQCGFYGGICYNGRQCQCPEGSHYVSDYLVCWPTRGLNEECTEDADCGVATSDSTQCLFDEPSEELGSCICKSDYHRVDDDCRLKAYSLGEGCITAYDCVFAHGNNRVDCEGRTCQCISGYFRHNDTSCEIGVGGECSTTSDCRNVENTECLENTCVCSDGYIRSSSTKCAPVAKEIGDECEDEEQCYVLTHEGENIYCDYVSGTCQCWPNYHYHNMSCWNTKYIDDACSYKSECIAENSVCMNNYCTCEYGYVQESKEKCVGSAPTVLEASFITLVTVAFASHLL